MPKTILITGSTDGIGLETAKMLVSLGHHVLVHGRNPAKLEAVGGLLSELPGGGSVETYAADLSRLGEVQALAKDVRDTQGKLDVLINNAGLYSADATTPDGLDARFVVNTIAPYLLTQLLLPLLGTSGRVINVTSAAQATVDGRALAGLSRLADMEAYGQSKLALTMWSRHMGVALKDNGPIVIAVNPGSMLGSKMVREAFGVAGGDLRTGAEILSRAALSDDFAGASGMYFDNDQRQFASPHPDALDPGKSGQLVQAIEALLAQSTN